MSRAEIESYAAARGVRFREDPSNGSVAYRRNRIRRQLLPLLTREYNPRIAEALAALATQAREDDDALTSAGRGAGRCGRSGAGPGGRGERSGPVRGSACRWRAGCSRRRSDERRSESMVSRVDIWRPSRCWRPAGATCSCREGCGLGRRQDPSGWGRARAPRRIDPSRTHGPPAAEPGRP